jgi:broad specificity phosphatase PhoE
MKNRKEFIKYSFENEKYNELKYYFSNIKKTKLKNGEIVDDVKYFAKLLKKSGKLEQSGGFLCDQWWFKFLCKSKKTRNRLKVPIRQNKRFESGIYYPGELKQMQQYANDKKYINDNKETNLYNNNKKTILTQIAITANNNSNKNKIIRPSIFDKILNVYFIRHGNSCANAVTEIAKPNPITKWSSIITETPDLTEIGIIDAKTVSENLKTYFETNNVKIDKIFSSSLLRAIETAYIINNKLKLNKIHITPYIKETNRGDFPANINIKGKHILTTHENMGLSKNKTINKLEKLKKHFDIPNNNADLDYTSFSDENQIPNVNTQMLDIKPDFDKFIRKIAIPNEEKKHGETNIIVVSHGRILAKYFKIYNKSIQVDFFDGLEDKYKLLNCGVVKVQFHYNSSNDFFIKEMVKIYPENITDSISINIPKELTVANNIYENIAGDGGDKFVNNKQVNYVEVERNPMSNIWKTENNIIFTKYNKYLIYKINIIYNTFHKRASRLLYLCEKNIIRTIDEKYNSKTLRENKIRKNIINKEKLKIQKQLLNSKSDSNNLQNIKIQKQLLNSKSDSNNLQNIKIQKQLLNKKQSHLVKYFNDEPRTSYFNSSVSEKKQQVLQQKNQRKNQRNKRNLKDYYNFHTIIENETMGFNNSNIY